MIDEHLSKKVKEAWVPLSNIVQNLYQRSRADPNRRPYSHHFGEWKGQAVRVVARERFFAVVLHLRGRGDDDDRRGASGLLLRASGAPRTLAAAPKANSCPEAKSRVRSESD